MYDVKGLPSIVTSTRGATAWGTTWMRGACVATEATRAPVTSSEANSLRIRESFESAGSEDLALHIGRDDGLADRGQRTSGQAADFDIPIPHLIRVILQQDVALLELAETLDPFE